MKERGVVVLSGIGTKVVDRFVHALNANGLDASFVNITAGEFDQDYFDRLLNQTLVVLERAKSRGDVSVRAFLVSGLADDASINLEKSTFFPALRRIKIDPAWRNNPDAAPKIQDAAVSYFQNRAEKDFHRTVSIRREGRYLLPLENTRCKALHPAFVSLYNSEASALTPRVYKEVAAVRKSKAFRVKGIDFTPTINSGKHPIRRCSASKRCDLEAAFRFGAPVDERLEFDVTCETGLRGRTFYQCDGTSACLNREPTHLNMRINDDYGAP